MAEADKVQRLIRDGKDRMSTEVQKNLLKRITGINLKVSRMPKFQIFIETTFCQF